MTFYELRALQTNQNYIDADYSTQGLDILCKADIFFHFNQDKK